MKYPFDEKNYGWLRQYARNRYSQFGEDGVVDVIFKVIGTEGRWCFECGAADGLFFSNTRALIEFGWNGVLVEANDADYSRLVVNSANAGGQCACFHARLDSEIGIDDILERAGAPKIIDLASIDVDGQDYYLFNAMLRYQARVVAIEHDPNVDDDYLPRLSGQGQAGIGVITRLMWGKSYSEVFRTLTNSVWVKRPLDRLLTEAVVNLK